MAGATAVGFAGAGTALTDVAGGVALGATAVDGAGDGRAGVGMGVGGGRLAGGLRGTVSGGGSGDARGFPQTSFVSHRRPCIGFAPAAHA